MLMLVWVFGDFISAFTPLQQQKTNIMNTTFKCTFDEFFLACRLVLMSMEANLAAFSDHKTFYNAAWLAAMIAELDALELLPNEEQREGQREMLLEDMKKITKKDVKRMMNRLRSYIKEGFVKEHQKSALEQAGFLQYDKALACNWEEVKSMLESGNTFINVNNAKLTTDGGMPAVFVTDFGSLKTDMSGKITTFLGMRQDTKEMTLERTVACNDYYLKIRKVMDDGQVILEDNPAKRERFVWESVLKIVTPPGAAGLRGSIKDGLTLEPIVGALVEFRDGVNPVIEVTTNALGKYDSGNLPVGNYSLKITKAGYGVLETSVEVKLGTVSYKHFMLGEAGDNQVIVEGSFELNEIANIAKPDGVNDDTWMELEVFDTTGSFFASDSVDGDITGTGALSVEEAEPLPIKWSEVVAQIGLNPANPNFNVKNVGGGSGSWRVVFVVG